MVEPLSRTASRLSRRAARADFVQKCFRMTRDHIWAGLSRLAKSVQARITQTNENDCLVRLILRAWA